MACKYAAFQIDATHEAVIAYEGTYPDNPLPSNVSSYF